MQISRLHQLTFPMGLVTTTMVLYQMYSEAVIVDFFCALERATPIRFASWKIIRSALALNFYCNFLSSAHLCGCDCIPPEWNCGLAFQTLGGPYSK